MSHVALQRVMVRMLFDADLTRRVHEDARTTLEGVPLRDDELAWLAGPDRRAWTVDPERPMRALGSLALRYPASVATALHAGTTLEDLLLFFRSTQFHRSVQERGSMAAAFADYLATDLRARANADRRVEPLVQLEHAMARLLVEAPMRPAPHDPTADPVVLSPDKRLHRAPAGTADLHEAMHAALARHTGGLAAAIVDGAIALPSGGIDFDRDETLLLEVVRGEGWRVSHVVGAAEISGELDALLAFASTPRSRSDLESEAGTLGATPDEAREVVGSLIDDGTLVACTDSGARFAW